MVGISVLLPYKGRGCWRSSLQRGAEGRRKLQLCCHRGHCSGRFSPSGRGIFLFFLFPAPGQGLSFTPFSPQDVHPPPHPPAEAPAPRLGLHFAQEGAEKQNRREQKAPGSRVTALASQSRAFHAFVLFIRLGFGILLVLGRKGGAHSIGAAGTLLEQQATMLSQRFLGISEHSHIKMGMILSSSLTAQCQSRSPSFRGRSGTPEVFLPPH